MGRDEGFTHLMMSPTGSIDLTCLLISCVVFYLVVILVVSFFIYTNDDVLLSV